MQRQGLTRPCPMSDDIKSSSRNGKVTWIMGHIRGEQQRCQKERKRKEAGENPCSHPLSQRKIPEASELRIVGVQQLLQGMVQEDTNEQPAGDWEIRLGVSRDDEN